MAYVAQYVGFNVSYQRAKKFEKKRPTTEPNKRRRDQVNKRYREDAREARRNIQRGAYG